MTDELQGKVALILGGSSGIGEATAICFAGVGAKVIVAGRRSTEGENTVRQIQEQGGEAFFVKTDVSIESDVAAVVDKTMSKYGRMDYAFNNAGVGKVTPLTSMTESEWDNIVDINLKGVFFALKYEILAMLQQGYGAIVNTASISGVVGMPGLSAYSASKGGVIALTRSAAIEYAKSNIRVNSVSLGTIQTSALDQVPPDLLREIEEGHPIGRIGKCTEVAEAVLWLCSDKSSFITGHNMMVDGGYSAQ